MALDNFRKINITLNKANQHISEPQITKVGDVNGRELVVQLIDEGVIKDQTGVTLKLNWQHANGNQGSETFSPLDAKQGIFSVYYPENMLFRGTVTASISINESGKITNSLNFQIAVKGDVFDGSAVEVDGILFTLKDLKDQLDERDNSLDVLESRQSSVENQFNSLQQEMTNKDVISSPEIIAARGSEETLKDRLDKEQQEVNAQLAQNEFEKKNKYGDFKLAIVDDDCRVRAYDFLIPLAERHNFKVTLAHAKIMRGEVNSDYMTMDKVVEVHDRGHEICAHTVSHRALSSILDDSELDYELRESKRWLSEHGIETEHIMYPYGRFDARVAEASSKYYKSGATSLSVSNRPLPTYGVGRLGIGASGETDDLEVIKKYINMCKETNNMCVIMTHVGMNTPEQDAILEQTIAYALSIGAEFVPYKELFEYHKNKIEYGSYNEQGKVKNLITQEGYVYSPQMVAHEASVNELGLRLKSLEELKVYEIALNEISIRMRGDLI